MTTSERTGPRSDEPAVGLAALAQARAERERPSANDPAPSQALADTQAIDAVNPVAEPAADGRSSQPANGRRGRATRSSGGTPPGAPPRPSSWWWRFGFPITLVLLILAIPVLVWMGKQAVLESSDGTLVAVNTDPAAPGWEAVTAPTPTMLLVQVDDTGSPVALTVLSQTGQSSGAVIFVPVTSVLTIPGYGSEPLNKAFADLGMNGLKQGVQNLMGVGLGEMQVIDNGQWTSLLEAVGPLQFTNTESLVAVPYLVFPKGPLTMQPAQAGPYLATPAQNSVDTNRLLRHGAFWTALLAKLAASPVPVPGDPDKGLAHFLPQLAKSQVDVETIPVSTVRLPGSNDTLFSPVADQLNPMIAKLIPFPTEASAGTRPKVRILDGTGKLSHGVGAAPLLVKGGGQIVAVGNAASFDVAQTQLVYGDDAQKDATDKLAASLGIGQVVKTGTLNADVDITVILGADYANQPTTGDTVITTPPANIGTVTVTSATGGGN